MAKGPVYAARDYNWQQYPMYWTRVDTGTTISGATTTATIVTVAATKFLTLKYARLRAVVTTVLNTAVAGTLICIADAAVTAPIAFCGSYAATNDAVGTQYTSMDGTGALVIPGGFKLAAIGNDLVAGATAACTSGVVRIVGLVGYDLTDS